MEDGYLTILHLGRLDGFLGFQSLKFIFEKIFPVHKISKKKWIMACPPSYPRVLHLNPLQIALKIALPEVKRPGA